MAKKTTKKAEPVAAPAEKKLNKSAIIREYVANHPEMGPTAVAAALSIDYPGEKFTAAGVSTTINLAKKAGGKIKAKPAKQTKTAKGGGGGGSMADSLVKASALLDAVGGDLDKASEILAAVHHIKS